MTAKGAKQMRQGKGPTSMPAAHKLLTGKPLREADRRNLVHPDDLKRLRWPTGLPGTPAAKEIFKRYAELLYVRHASKKGDEHHLAAACRHEALAQHYLAIAEKDPDEKIGGTLACNLADKQFLAARAILQEYRLTAGTRETQRLDAELRNSVASAEGGRDVFAKMAQIGTATVQ